MTVTKRRFALSILLLLLLTAVVVVIVLLPSFTSPFKGYEGEKVVEIPKGTTIAGAARILEREGIVANRWSVRLIFRLRFRNRSLHAGEFLFDQPLSPEEVIRRLTSEYGLLLTLTVKEGENLFDIVDTLKRADWKGSDRFLEAAQKRTDLIEDLFPGAPSLEGFLFPDTYRFARGVSPDKILETLTLHFRKRLLPLWSRRPEGFPLTVPEVVTLSSLVEKETAVAEERPLIASVFRNRLRKKMLLQCDPTFIYALRKDGLWSGKTGSKEIHYDSPYNTYVQRGLPPGPIGNPGEEALKAVFSQTESDYLFFVSQNDGTHRFSRTLEEHNRAVYRFQKRKRVF